MWNVILWFVIGGLVGYLAQRYVLLGRPGMVADVVVGAVSAVVVNVILSLLIQNYFSFTYIMDSTTIKQCIYSHFGLTYDSSRPH